MVEISNRLAAILDNSVIDTVYFLKLGSILKMNSSPSEYTLSNGEVYEKNTRIVQIDPARLSSVVDRELYSITLSDNDFAMRAVIESGIMGMYGEIRAAFVDQSTGLLITDIADTILIYAGTVGAASADVDASTNGSSNIKIQFTSPMGSLDMTKSFYSSSDFMRQRNPDDSSFDQVYLGSGPIVARWGKA